MAVYVVTGGAGFIGSNIVKRLVKDGHRVRVVDNLLTGRRENLQEVRDDIEFVEGDIRDGQLLARLFKGADYVLHQAALPSVPRSVKDPVASHEANITGTLQVLIAARDAGVKRVVYAASSSAYGDTPVLPKVETMAPNPLSPYAVTKLAGEYYCRVFYHVYGLETVSLRYFNVFGPRQDPNSQYAAVIPRFITAMLKGEAPVIFGDGEQTRDFSYIDNVVEANLLACQAPGAAGEVFNIACGESISLNDLVKELNHILGTDIKPVYTNPRPGDVRHSLADISKAGKILGYKPQINWREGLRRTVEWYRSGVEDGGGKN